GLGEVSFYPSTINYTENKLLLSKSVPQSFELFCIRVLIDHRDISVRHGTVRHVLACDRCRGGVDGAQVVLDLERLDEERRGLLGEDRRGREDVGHTLPL